MTSTSNDKEDEGPLVPPVPHPVFEDPSKRRIRFVTGFVLLASLLAIVWTVEFALRVYRLEPPGAAPGPLAAAGNAVAGNAVAGNWAVGDGAVGDAVTVNAVAGNAVAPVQTEVTDVVMTPGAETDCGQGLLAILRPASGVAGFVPYRDPTALSGLRAQCGRLDAVFYEAFSFGAPDGQIRLLGPGSAAFPLPDFHSGWRARNRPAAFAVLRPVEGLSPAAIEEMFAPSGTGGTGGTGATGGTGGALVADIAALALDGVDGGLCLDMSRHGAVAATALLPVLDAMRQRLMRDGLQTCLIGPADAGFWDAPGLLGRVDRAVPLAFRPDTAPSAPPAPRAWSGPVLAGLTSRVAAEKLWVGVGTFGLAWQSGRRTPERISFVESLLRAGLHGGEVSFGPEVGNTAIRYLDEQRRLNQIWLLDAAAFHNARRDLGGTPQVVLWPLGYEDPAIWRLLEEGASAGEVLERPLDLSNHGAVEGEGPFSRLIGAASPGQRTVAVDATTGHIVGQDYTRLPSPHRLGFFGSEAPAGRLALTFNGLGSARRMDDLLALLAERAIPATFFVSTRDLLRAREAIPSLLEAGHGLGAATVPRSTQSWFAETMTRTQNNLTQHMLGHFQGVRARLVRNPAQYGPLPGSVAVLDQLQHLQAEGYVTVHASAPADFGRIDADAFLAMVREEALARPVNVLSFDFTRESDRDTVEALPGILDALLDDGLTFAALDEMAGLSAAGALPAAGTAPLERDAMSYTVMQFGWIGAQRLILLLALIVAIRAPLFVVLAFFRRLNYPFDERYCPPVTVIIPAYNEAQVIERTVQMALEADYPDFRVFVVDDGSTDETAEIVAERFGQDPRVTLLRQENHGKWYALDLALNRVETPFIVIVDADSLLDRDALKLLVQPFRDPQIGAVAGTVEVGNRENLLTTFQAIEYLHTQQVMRRAYEVFDGVIVVPGAAGAWRVSAVREAGGLSGDTITEDADLTVAMHRAGYRVAYQDEAKSYTEVPNSVRVFLRQRLRWNFGMFQVSWKHKQAIREGLTVGYISIVDAIWYTLATSLIYPALDAILIVALFYWGYSVSVDGLVALKDFPVSGSLAFLMLALIDAANIGAAFWFARRFEWRLLAAAPILRFGYRQLLYTSQIRAILMAVAGRVAAWNKAARSGTVNAVR